MVHADAAALPPEIRSKAEFYSHLQTQLGSLLDGQRNWVSNLANASSVLYASLNRFQQRLAELKVEAEQDKADKAAAAEDGAAANGGESTAAESAAAPAAPIEPLTAAKTINWAGFYLLSPFFPTSDTSSAPTYKRPTLLLGPFCGLPACQQISSVPGRGVCADASALLPPRVVRVDKTDDYPGHIACDSASQSEIVVPLVISRSKQLSRRYREALDGSRATDGEANADGEPAAKVRKLDDESAAAAVPVEWQGRGDGDEIIIGVLDIDCEQVEGFDEEDERGLKAVADLIAAACDW